MLDLSIRIRLDRSAPGPLAAQLVCQLRDLVLSGELAEREALPSSRSLAEALGVARSVVVRAFEQLCGEGYLDARAGSATRVAEGIVAAPPPSPSGPPHPQGPSSPTGSALAVGLQGSGADPGRSGAGSPIDLRTGNPFAPMAVPDEWRRALVVAAREPFRSYAPAVLGEPRLREQIALHVRRSRGVLCAPEDVVVTSGTSDALLLVALALGAGARVATEDPGYPEAVAVLEAAGLVADPVPVAAEGLEVGGLAGLAVPPDAVLVTPSHQFPLGGRMPAAERTALVAWAARTGALVIEDDYDSEFRHVGRALPAIASLDPGGTVAHIGSLNKVLSPALRCGYLIATAGSPIRRRIDSMREVLGSSVPLVTQSALASYFSSGGFRRYVARARREYRHRRGLLLARFAEQGRGDLLSGLDGGLHAVLRLPGGSPGEEVASGLAERGVLVESVTRFARLPRRDDALALGYGSEPATRLDRGLAEVLRAIG